MPRTTQPISVKLPKEHYAQLGLIAHRTGISRHALLKKAVATLLLFSEGSQAPQKSHIAR